MGKTSTKRKPTKYRIYSIYQACKMPNYITESQKNGFKLQLLRNKCEEYQRKCFHKHFPTDTKLLYAELKKHDNKFQNRKILKQEQYDILFAASGETDSKTFDRTLLAFLLRTVRG